MANNDCMPLSDLSLPVSFSPVLFAFNLLYFLKHFKQNVKPKAEMKAINSNRGQVGIALTKFHTNQERIKKGSWKIDIEDITRWPENMIYCSGGKKISQERRQPTSEILFLLREHKVHIFIKLTCNVLFINLLAINKTGYRFKKLGLNAILTHAELNTKFS